MKPPKAVKIHIVYDDGSHSFAEGQAASDVWDWLTMCETLAFMHNAQYKGTPMIQLTAEEVANKREFYE